MSHSIENRNGCRHNGGMEQQPPNQQDPQTPPDAVRVRITLPTVQPILTYSILAVLFLIFSYYSAMTVFEQNQFWSKWAKVNEKIYEGEYYRLFTAMFLHLDLAHLLFNSWALYLFGRDVEGLFGHLRFAIIYVLGGLAGSVASLLYTDAPSLGASGAIFAIFSAMGVYLYQHRHLYGQFANMRLMQMVALGVVNIIFGLMPGTRIDNAAHIGGALGGFILAWFICPEFQPRRDPTEAGKLLMIDANTPDKWIIAPVLFGVGMVASVAYATAVLG